MKLYATITDESGKQRGLSSDNRLIIELRHKNARAKFFEFRVEKGTDGHNWEIEDVSDKAHATD